jgi:hypothetical protein
MLITCQDPRLQCDGGSNAIRDEREGVAVKKGMVE